MMDFHAVYFDETRLMIEMAFTELHCRDTVGMMNDISINVIVDCFLHVFIALPFSELLVLALSQELMQFPLAMSKSLIGCG